MRVLFLGQKPIGQRCFERLLGRPGLEVVGAVSNTTLETWWRDAAIHRRCVELGLPFVDNARRRTRELAALIEGTRVDALLSVQHAWVLPGPLLELVRGRAFNLHLAPLPGYQGWHGPSHALLRGDARYGTTLHWMVAAVDAGPAAYVASFDLLPHDTARSVYARAEAEGVTLFDRLLDDLTAGRTPPRAPLEGQPRFFARDALDAHREVRDLGDPAAVERVARALHFPPFEPAFVRLAGRKVYLVPQDGGA